jgi:hypothetical protein
LDTTNEKTFSGTNETTNLFKCEIPAKVRDWIFNMTRGHGGLALYTLHFMTKKCRTTTTDDELFWVLLSNDFKSYIESTRPYELIKSWSLDRDDDEFLQELIIGLDEKSSITTNFVESGTDVTNKFIDKGGAYQ